MHVSPHQGASAVIIPLVEFGRKEKPGNGERHRASLTVLRLASRTKECRNAPAAVSVTTQRGRRNGIAPAPRRSVVRCQHLPVCPAGALWTRSPQLQLMKRKPRRRCPPSSRLRLAESACKVRSAWLCTATTRQRLASGAQGPTRERLPRRRAASRRDDRGDYLPLWVWEARRPEMAPFGRFVEPVRNALSGTNQYRPALAH
jgi:hypothetical protein